MKITVLLPLILLYAFATSAQSFRINLDKGDEYFNANDYENAILYFSKAIAADPKNDTGFWYRGDAYFYQKKYQEAAQDFTQAINLRPGFWKYHYKKGNCLARMNQHALALDFYSEALRLKPDESGPWFERAWCYNQLNDTVKSCSDYQQAYNLGEKKVLSEAGALGCDWARKIIDEKPCPKPSTWVENNLDIFTGASFISKGLSCKDFEIKSKTNNVYLTDNLIGIDEEINIKILKPKGFCADGNGDSHFGTSYSISDSLGNVVIKVDDLYKNQTKGIPEEYLKSLSVSLKLNSLGLGMKYILRISFFDKRSEAKLDVVFPFSMVEKTAVHMETKASTNMLGLGINSVSVNASAESMEFSCPGETVTADAYKMKPDKKYKITLNGVKALAMDATFNVQFVSKQGEYTTVGEGKTISDGNFFAFTFHTAAIKPGSYNVHIRLKDSSGSMYNFVIPTYVK